ncbi:zinc finger CCCH domain-containing protein 14-like protein [Cinnamomum micranthum f. kanehirae]|uniref:Zinc finger CCCH domain-containing protein 14-like protein n=1 Tax=Cinnamomum micranthum f. kanehirae TaxID=337451 RepID=A0A3S3R3S3_9MAGN|nr:zinc finger CCCH domain-containing protein 14-like protein [Cinnamomum micranthum f. kanehirae]
MQMEKGSCNGGIRAAISQTHQLLPTSPRSQLNGYDLSGLYASIFPITDSHPNSNSISLTPSPSSCDEENPNSTENRLYLARVMLQYQQLAEKYGLCLTHLRQTIQESEVLRQENAELRIANDDLTRRLSLLSLPGKQNPLQSRVGSSSGFPLQSVMDSFQRLCVGETGQSGRVSVETPEASPTSVLGFEENRFQRVAPDRVSLPKSISVRSSGFLKVNQPAGENGASSSRTSRARERSPVAISSQQQRVYVPGGRQGEGSLELEVYNQGMFKTELCNKWQETGTCPYGDHCQFAHGIGELRPVIRHPRYKTEVCRMVLAGDTCPYGHRCHFRHALTEEERTVVDPA